MRPILPRPGRPRFCAVDWFDDEHHENEHGVDRAYPAAIRRPEGELLRARRRAAGAAGAADAGERPPVAVGLSGGGIRSATFCLGFFQGLAKLNPAALPRPSGGGDADATRGAAALRAGSLLGRLDAVSSVSGGGYFGAFFGRFFQPRGDAGAAAGVAARPDRLPAVECSLADNFSREMRWLRENGRYLAPNGSGDALLAGAVIFRNWVALQLVLATFLQAAFLALQGIVHLAAAGLVAAGLGDELSQVQQLFQGSEPYWVWRSPLLVLPLAGAVLAVAPAAWAYWMLPSRKRRDQLRWRGLVVRFPSFAALTASLAVASIALLASLPRLDGVASDEALVISAVAGALAVVGLVALLLWLFYFRPWRAVDVLEAQAPGARTALSKFLRFWLFTGLGLLALALVDGLGQTLYAAAVAGDGAVRALLVGLFGGGSLLAEAVRRLIKLVGDKLKSGPQKGGSYLRLALVVAAAAAVIAIALVASTLSHAIAWAFQPPNVPVQLAFLEAGGYVRPGPSLNLIVAGFLLFTAVSFGIARTYSFLNYSSHHLMYAARLTRAYLGASNPARHDDDVKVTDVHPGDDLPDLRHYAPHEWGGPLHFVNVTVNETISGRSNVQQQDRKGVGLTAGPCGLSAGKSHHALWHDERHANGAGGSGFRMFPRLEGAGFTPEPLSLGQWVAISGAAFTTGAGVRTSLPMALLAGLANVRLGYWWDSGIEPGDRAGERRRGSASMLAEPAARTAGLLRRLFPTQLLLVDELTARFRGPSVRRWYLSDGGHFENLGGYELIRRRFPLILLLDAEADPDYAFEGLAGLVRKARIDFGAEIRFLDQDELERLFDGAVPRAVGPLSGLGREARHGCSSTCTALAMVEYPVPPAERPNPVSLLVYVKAALCEDAPLDLAEYHRNHPDFPHESTGDQFFDEAQWESYRRLGEWQAMTLFGADGWDLLGDGGGKQRFEALIDRMNRSLEPEPADLPGTGEHRAV